MTTDLVGQVGAVSLVKLNQNRWFLCNSQLTTTTGQLSENANVNVSVYSGLLTMGGRRDGPSISGLVAPHHISSEFSTRLHSCYMRGGWLGV